MEIFHRQRASQKNEYTYREKDKQKGKMVRGVGELKKQMSTNK